MTRLSGRGKGIDWKSVADLGKVHDCVIAQRLGVSDQAVAQARKKLGIEPVGGPGSGAGNTKKIDVKKAADDFFSGKDKPPAPPPRKVKLQDRVDLEKEADAILERADGRASATFDGDWPVVSTSNEKTFRQQLDQADEQMRAMPDRVRFEDGPRRGWDAAIEDYKQCRGAIVPLSETLKVSAAFREGWFEAQQMLSDPARRVLFVPDPPSKVETKHPVQRLPADTFDEKPKPAEKPPQEPEKAPSEPKADKAKDPAPKSLPLPVQVFEDGAVCYIDISLSLQGVRDRRNFVCAMSSSAANAAIEKAMSSANVLKLPDINGSMHFYASASIDAVDVTPIPKKAAVLCLVGR